MDLVPLHVRSGYSLCRGCVSPEALIERATASGHGALALTDVNGLYGATEFYRQAVEAGLRPIVGAELRVDDTVVVALVVNRTGYENLCQLITRIHAKPANNEHSPSGDRPTRRQAGRDEDPAKTAPAWIEQLSRFHDGLHLITEEVSLAGGLVRRGVSTDCVWLEVDPATQPPAAVQRLAAAGDQLGVGLVGTGKALLSDRGDLPIARVLAAVRLGRTVDDLAGADLPHPRAVLRSPRQLREQFRQFPQAVANNHRLADACRYRLLPQEPVFPRYPCPTGQSPPAHLRQLCLRGVRRRYGHLTEAVRTRLETELRLIERKGFSEYFLVVGDIVRYARRQRAPTAGRGSGASSLVAYVLGITNVCPLAMEIPFERFLNESRNDFPDLDIDFCWRIRDDVIDYAFRRWGDDRVAMVSTHNTFQARSAFRETAKAMGRSDQQISQLQRGGETAGDEECRRIAQLSRRIVGLPHLLSVHPGGIVIGRKPIDHYAPVQPALKGVRITQYDKDGVEDIGLVKLDLLGNRSLSTISEACRLIGTHATSTRKAAASPTAPAVDIDRFDRDDPSTFDLLRRGDTVGCNQLESPAMRHLLRAVRPRDLRDIMKALALIRPGAASIGMKEAFIRRQRGLEPAPAGHGVLADTHGIMLYEDDVMLVAAALLGTSLAEADRFRKAVQSCRRDSDQMDLSREFIDRCGHRGVDADYAAEVWVQMAKFNAYSFCRAHAASYARLAYVVAYLKAHYPLQFWTAALNNNQSMYPPRVYVEQARLAAIRFLLPDVNHSDGQFRIDGEAIRVGLDRVQGLGPAGIDAVLAGRRRRPYVGLSDLMDRTDLTEEQVRSLVLCGSLDGLGLSRPALMMERGLYRPGRAGRNEQTSDQALLLPVAPTVAPGLRDYSARRKRRDQRRILSLSVDGHPLVDWRSGLTGRVDCDCRDLGRQIGKRVRIAGLLEAVRATETRAGRSMRFFTFDDEYGLFEATAFDDTCRVDGRPGTQGPAIITGQVQEHYGTVTIAAEEVSWQSGGNDGNGP